jgi:hypothetical protein
VHVYQSMDTHETVCVNTVGMSFHSATLEVFCDSC